MGVYLFYTVVVVLLFSVETRIMCVCVCVCVCVCARALARACMYVCIYVCVYVCIIHRAVSGRRPYM